MDKIFQKRHSVRNFQAKEISREHLKEILEAVNSAPSAGNLKAREILAVEDSETKERLAKAALGQYFVAEAPVILVFFAAPERSARKYGKRGRDLYALQDATISASFAWLQAVILGLSACWIGAFNDKEVKEVLEIKDDWQPIALMPIGYEK